MAKIRFLRRFQLNGTWYKKGDPLDVTDRDTFRMLVNSQAAVWDNAPPAPPTPPPSSVGGADLSNVEAVARHNGTSYPLRADVTSGATRRVRWVGPVAPTFQQGYAEPDDVWEDTSGPTSVTFAIAAAGDDGHNNGGAFDATGSVYLGTNGNAASRTFLRFAGVTIPRGKTITSARVRLTMRSAVGSLALKAAAVDADNPAAPASGTALGALVLTSAESSTWTVPAAAWTFDARTYTPDLAGPIQRIVNRPGWESGNAVIVVLKDAGSSADSRFSAYGYDSSPAEAARLEVTYE